MPHPHYLERHQLQYPLNRRLDGPRASLDNQKTPLPLPGIIIIIIIVIYLFIYSFLTAI
jgi:hypothetical protein